jgi:hypothetical protein
MPLPHFWMPLHHAWPIGLALLLLTQLHGANSALSSSSSHRQQSGLRATWQKHTRQQRRLILQAPSARDGDKTQPARNVNARAPLGPPPRSPCMYALQPMLHLVAWVDSTAAMMALDTPQLEAKVCVSTQTCSRRVLTPSLPGAGRGPDRPLLPPCMHAGVCSGDSNAAGRAQPFCCGQRC